MPDSWRRPTCVQAPPAALDSALRHRRPHQCAFALPFSCMSMIQQAFSKYSGAGLPETRLAHRLPPPVRICVAPLLSAVHTLTHPQALVWRSPMAHL